MKTGCQKAIVLLLILITSSLFLSVAALAVRVRDQAGEVNGFPLTLKYFLMTTFVAGAHIHFHPVFPSAEDFT